MVARTRFGVSLEQTLLHTFDRWLTRKGFASRSQAIAELIRDGLVQQAWKNANGVVIGVVTLVYDPAHHVLSHTLARTQHGHHEHVLSSQHIHLDQHNCLEVIVLKGKAREVEQLADHLRAVKGVKHGQFIMTTSGQALA